MTPRPDAAGRRIVAACAGAALALGLLTAALAVASALDRRELNAATAGLRREAEVTKRLRAVHLPRLDDFERRIEALEARP